MPAQGHDDEASGVSAPPRRSLHFVPGGEERMFAKALTLPADSLILDLEDSVPPERKERARETVCGWLAGADFGGRERLIRINPLDTPWGRDDLEAALAARVGGVVLPKAATRAGVDAVDRMIAAAERRHGIPSGAVSLVLIGTETPGAVFNLPGMAENPRVGAVAWGAEDLAWTLGAGARRDGRGDFLPVFSHVRSVCLLAAAAAGVQPIDAVFTDIGDPEGLRRESEAAAAMGYAGKITIHPSQVDIVNAAFTPDPEAVAEARELVAAFEENQAAGRMAFLFRGEMVDVPHLRRARRILAAAGG